MKKYDVGTIKGANNALLILAKIDDNKYKVQCQICKNDEELYGDAIYDIAVDYFTNNKLPCGCSKSPRRSERQWEVIIKRKARENNSEFLGFVGGSYINQNTKIFLRCNSCDNMWDSCSVANFIRGKTCPRCANVSRGENNAKSNDYFIDRFRATGLFPEGQYSFERTTNTGRLWKVKCSKCGDIEFTVDRSNLIAGKIPCNCGTGGGFDINKTGYFYILNVIAFGNEFLKFGISNYPKRRITGHKRTLREIGGEIVRSRFFRGDGNEVLAIESALKRDLEIDNKFIDGFRRESCNLSNIDKILAAVSALEAIDNVSL